MRPHSACCPLPPFRPSSHPRVSARRRSLWRREGHSGTGATCPLRICCITGHRPFLSCRSCCGGSPCIRRSLPGSCLHRVALGESTGPCFCPTAACARNPWRRWGIWSACAAWLWCMGWGAFRGMQSRGSLRLRTAMSWCLRICACIPRYRCCSLSPSLCLPPSRWLRQCLLLSHGSRLTWTCLVRNTLPLRRLRQHLLSPSCCTITAHGASCASGSQVFQDGSWSLGARRLLRCPSSEVLACSAIC